jgi:hypothetical protein
MSDTIEYQPVFSPEPPDEAMWNAWLQEKLLAGEKRRATCVKAVKWACMGATIATAVVFWHVSASNVPAFQAAIRLGIAFGAIVAMFASLHGRLYSFTGLLGAIVLVFALSGNWSILLASVLPFAGFLIWIRERTRWMATPASSLGIKDWTSSPKRAETPA